MADLQTPVGLYLKIRDLYPGSSLLESSDYHGGENSYSFIGFYPIGHYKVKEGLIERCYPGGQTEFSQITEQETVYDNFNEYIGSFEIEYNDKKNDLNGFFGYTSYDAIRYFERFDSSAQPKGKNDVDDLKNLPELFYVLYKYILIIDPHKNVMTIVENLREGETGQIEVIKDLLENRNIASYDFETVGNETSTSTDSSYKEMVKKGIAHCLRGNVFQLVLSRRFMQRYKGDDFKVYRSLRSINPSPYLFYFDFGSYRIFGSSPETHLRIKGNNAYIDPIAGTFKRTGDDRKDALLAEALRNDPKENAEHVMLVDLARNDLSRNALHVRPEIYKDIQFYSHVIHMVSRVKGELPETVNHLKVFADSFPAGTLSGAPKIRAMQIIDELEPHRRGVYGGCIGYIGFNGDLNQAITIRTFLSMNNTLYYQAGAGIVAKSKEENELNEVNNKLGALKNAIDSAVLLKN